MHCSHCGQTIQAGQRYCHACGRAVDAGSTQPVNQAGPTQTNRLTGRRDLAWHVHLLGILWIAFAVVRLIPAFGFLTVRRIGFPFLPPGLRAWIWPLTVPISVMLFAIAAVEFLAGWGLLERAPRARVLALVVGIIALIHPPFGTALGIYPLWALLPSESEVQYRTLSRSV